MQFLPKHMFSGTPDRLVWLILTYLVPFHILRFSRQKRFFGQRFSCVKRLGDHFFCSIRFSRVSNLRLHPHIIRIERKVSDQSRKTCVQFFSIISPQVFRFFKKFSLSHLLIKTFHLRERIFRIDVKMDCKIGFLVKFTCELI